MEYSCELLGGTEIVLTFKPLGGLRMELSRLEIADVLELELSLFKQEESSVRV